MTSTVELNEDAIKELIKLVDGMLVYYEGPSPCQSPGISHCICEECARKKIREIKRKVHLDNT